MKDNQTPFMDVVFLITANGLGHGPQDLQLTLMAKFLELLNLPAEGPSAICFYTDGVKLVVADSPVLKQLHALEDKGVRLIVCSTCLNYFGITEKVMVGIVGGMPDILEAMQSARKVISV